MGKRNLQASHDVAGWVDACVLPSARTANATWVLTLLLLFNCQTSSAATSLPPTAGPVLSVAPDGLHLRLDGKPWFWLADTAWLAIWQLDERGITDYLEDRASRGIRIIQGPIIGNEAVQPPYDGGIDDPFIRDEVGAIRLNDAFWYKVDHLVSECARLHLALFLAPSWGHSTLRMFGSESQWVQYAAAVARRYTTQAHVNYIAVGEYHKIRYLQDASGNILDIPKRRLTAAEHQYLRAGAQALRANMHPGALLAFHGDGWQPVYRDWQDEPAVSFYMHQSYASLTDAALAVSRSNARAPHKPFVQAEIHYESDEEDAGQPSLIRAAAYHTLFLGGAGFTYGNQAIWKFAPDWRKHLEDPGGRQIFHVLRRFTQAMYDEKNMPANELIAGAHNRTKTDPQISVMRSGDSRQVWAYVSHGQTFRLSSRHLPEGTLNAGWFNPRDGSRKDFRIRRRQVNTFNPPGRSRAGNDWVLTLKIEPRP